jgi:hypothetical protein
VRLQGHNLDLVNLPSQLQQRRAENAGYLPPGRDSPGAFP